MKIAVVSTGLGHVARGIEAWARELARNLTSSRTTDCGLRTTERIEVTLFGAGGIPATHVSRFTFHVIPSFKRSDLIVRLWSRFAPAFTWRWGWKSGYTIEQKSFAKHLIPYLQSGEYDVVHTQDPVLALALEAARKQGVIKTPVILAHGTDDTPEFLKDITYLQHLCLDYRKKWLKGKEYSEKGEAWETESCQHHFCIPNFVDTTRFCPKAASARNTEDQSSNAPISQSSPMRNALGIPGDALVIGCSAALQFHHKRLDYLIKEVSGVGCRVSEREGFFLLLAGASTDETPMVESLAEELLGDRCKILKDLSFDEMPDFYRALDLYVHPAYDEFYSVSVLEAMASGVPVVAHPSPSLSEQVFNESYLDIEVPSAGESVDMKEEGAIERFIKNLMEGNEGIEGWVNRLGWQARKRAEKIFSWKTVDAKFLMMYKTVTREI